LSYYCSYIAPIKKTDLEGYRQISKEISALFMELGALEFHEFVADQNASNQPYSLGSFGTVVKCGDDETIIMGWSVWPSRQALDHCNEQLSQNPRAVSSQANFDTGRLIMASFVPLAA
jgi:uncharacterized protein YbaA (DUF1428 family)